MEFNLWHLSLVIIYYQFEYGCKSKNIEYIFYGQDKNLRYFIHAILWKTSLRMNKLKIAITQRTPVTNRSSIR